MVQDTSGIFKTTDQDGTEPVDAITASNAHHLKKETAGEDDEAKPSATITCASPGNDHAVSMDAPTNTIRPADLHNPLRQNRRRFTIAEVKRLMSFPDDFKLTGSYNKQWKVCGNAVPPLMMRAVADQVRDSLTSA